MNYFQPDEFTSLPHMNLQFLAFLDDVRGRAGLPFHLTSDYRAPDRNQAAGGSPTSLHLLGRAVDFTLPAWTPETLFKVARAVTHSESSDSGIELEFDLTNKHVHLGLFPDNRPHRLVVKA